MNNTNTLYLRPWLTALAALFLLNCPQAYAVSTTDSYGIITLILDDITDSSGDTISGTSMISESEVTVSFFANVPSGMASASSGASAFDSGFLQSTAFDPLDMFIGDFIEGEVDTQTSASGMPSSASASHMESGSLEITNNSAEDLDIFLYYFFDWFMDLENTASGETSSGSVSIEVIHDGFTEVSEFASDTNTATGLLAPFNFGESLYSFTLPSGQSSIVDISLSALASSQVSAVPVPATLWLMGSGLIGLAGFARGRRPAKLTPLTQ